LEIVACCLDESSLPPFRCIDDSTVAHIELHPPLPSINWQSRLLKSGLFMNAASLFRDALAKPPGERAGFLEVACGRNADLRAVVQSMLDDHERTGESAALPSNPTQETSAFAQAPSSTGDFRPMVQSGLAIAGRYVLESKLGEGGMGEVWAARQTQPVKRRVALKLIKTGMDSKAVLARFEAERQALAVMDHPNIAKVLDAGLTPTGQPFFVMELVAGLPLNKFCDDAKLGVRERLELFVPICQAVQHAHHKGIVHRDLKPANILIATVDGRPIPKVIDFGVAKATSGSLVDASMATHFGAVVGTLEYMAPEQAGAAGEDVDTRADIYSLGVVLYELLTGMRPIDAARLKKAALTEMIRIIREEEPSKPSTRLSTADSLPSVAAVRRIEPKKLTALLRGELDWVVMKCLEKSRDRRYETASGLARDIQRYLMDEVVEARPPSAAYRLKKYLRRHRGVVAAASLLLLAVLGGLGAVVVVQKAANGRLAEANQRIAEERDEAERQRKSAADAKATAEANERTARQQAMLALTSMQLIVTEVDRKLTAQPGMAPLRISLLKILEKKWDELDVAMAGGIAGEAIPTLMAVRAKIADAWVSLDHIAEADAQYKRISEQAEQRLILKDRSDSARYNLALICRHWAPIKARLTSNPTEAQALRDRAVELLKEIRRDPRPQTGSPGAHFISEVLQGLLIESASSWVKEGDRAKAEAKYAEVGQICEAVLRDAESNAKWFVELKPELQKAVLRLFTQNLEISRAGRANNLCALGKVDEADAIYRGVIERSRAAQAKAPEDVNAREQLGLQLLNYGQYMQRAGRLDVASKNQAEAIGIFEGNYNNNPTDARLKRTYASGLYYFGVTRDAQGRAQEANALFKKSRDLRKELHAVSADTANKVNLMLAEAQLDNARAVKALAEQLSKAKSKDPDLKLDLARAMALLYRQARGADRDAFRKSALAALNQCLADGQKDQFVLASQHDLSALRDDAEFSALLAKLAPQARASQ